MIARAVAWLVTGGSVLALFAYGLTAHQFSVVDDRSPASYLFAILSIFGVLAFTAILNKAWTLLALILLTGTAFGWWFWQHARLSTTWIYLIQHAGAHGCLAILFGISLLPGKTPLVTKMASFLHSNENPARDRYTRQVTWAWTTYFAVVSLASLSLFATGQNIAWSWLVNILPIPMLAIMFVAEFLVRRWRLPDDDPTRLTDGWRAYQRLRSGGDRKSRDVPAR